MKRNIRRLQALERNKQRQNSLGRLALVLGVGKTPEQIDREIAEIRRWLPESETIIILDV